MKLVSFRILFAALLLVPLAAFSASGNLDFNLKLTLPKLDKLEQRLNLTPAQKAQYDVALAATKRVLVSGAIAAMGAKQRIADELAKPRPDLGALADLRESITEQLQPLQREARAEWLKLYAMLDDSQVAVIKSFVEDQLDQVGLLHELMLQLVLGRMR